MRKHLITGNWKMYKTPKQARELAQQLKTDLAEVKDVDIAICPPFTALPVVAEAIKGSNIELGAQNMHYETKGAFTGEISPEFLLELGCKYVILGHSERRQYFNETDELINKKLMTALKMNISPIFCIGEKLSERESGKTFDIIKSQLNNGLAGIKEGIDKIIIAYEPIWAIGTGKTATPKQAAEVHEYIRDWLKKNCSLKVAEEKRILYGGSVKPDNIDELMAEKELDGALVGGASLEALSFIRLVKFQKV
ncbi:MAG: triose-phosphate isomerase [candidate division WOR-3 bacterium]|nr:triose-phosphate isomerase [candidate division WOR-3 bacterium]